jgi:CubicO group peptidase (beta-lactamase class C family)
MRLGWLLLLLLASTAAATEVDDRIAALEQSLRPLLLIKGETPQTMSLAERMAQLQVEAVSIAVINGGRVEWARAYGFADREKGIRATPDTLFQAGSISKPVAALAALRLIEDGKLGLDTNVNDELKSWHLPDNEFTTRHKVTIRNILNHTAGTTVWGFPGYAHADKVPTVVEVLEGKGNTDAIRVWKEPDQSWRYSGGGYTILQLLLTDVSGRPFPALMEAMVLKPLGMTSSTYEQPLPMKWQSRAAHGYRADGSPVAGGWHIYPEMAAAGLWTTPSDLAKYLLEVQQERHGKGHILAEKTTALMLTPGMNNHGLGPVINQDGKRFGHGGADEGFQADMTAFLDGTAGVVIMTNSDNGSLLARQIETTLGGLYGWAGMAPMEKTIQKVATEALQQLAGTYAFPEGPGTFTLRAQGQTLVLSSPGRPDTVLWPESELKFFQRETGLPVEFTPQGDSVSVMIGNNRAVRQSL